MSVTNGNPFEQSNSLTFGLEGLNPLDQVLLTGLIDDFGGNVEAAGGFVDDVTAITEQHRDAEKFVDLVMGQRERGKLKLRYMDIPTDQFRIQLDLNAKNIAADEAKKASVRLTESLAVLASGARADRAIGIAGALGLSITEHELAHEFNLTERDEERAKQLSLAARLMRPSYGQLMKAMPELSIWDPEAQVRYKRVQAGDSNLQPPDGGLVA